MIGDGISAFMEEHQKSKCCCASVPDLVRLGSSLCPLICPWLPFNSTAAKVNAEEARRKEEQQENVLESECDIECQEVDKKKYKYVMLKNGMKILLIEDSTASTSACALEIKVGNFSDPSNLPGLAHLLEHIIFTGSELFPNEGFGSYLSTRGGSNNAYTASTYTNFHFQIPKEHFLDALDRFVSYFICPVFHEQTIQNEIEIIQCEHQKNKHNDVWRANQVEKCSANPKHPFSKFSTGNRATLQVAPGCNKNLKYEVYSFYKRNYSANIMSACLLHNTSINKLEEIVLAKFIHIPNKNIPQMIYRNSVFRNNQMGLKLFIVPLREIFHLNLTFPLVGFSSYPECSPATFISHLLHHKGKGSIFSHLRRLGFAHHVVSTHKTFDFSDISFLIFTIQLTEYGERHTDGIISIVFEYLCMLKHGPLPEYFHQELYQISNQLFAMKEQDQSVSIVEQAAHAIHLYTPKHIVSGEYKLAEWDPEKIANILSFLTPNNLRITVLSKNAKYLETKVEPYYGTEYHVDKISQEVMAEWKSVKPSEEMSLPEPNEYLTNSVDPLIKTGKNRRQPELTVNLERVRMRVWSSPDTRFVLPKSSFQFRFSWEGCYSTPRDYNLLNLMVYILKDAMVEIAYPATLAGLMYSLKASKYGMEILVRGHAKKQTLKLISELLDQIYGLDFKEETFELVYDVHKKGLLSCLAEPLKSQSKYLMNTLLSSRVWSREQRWENLQQITLKDVLDFAQRFLENHRLECLAFGDIDIDQTRQLTDVLLKRRAEFLDQRCEQLQIKVDMNPLLADWFKSDHVEKIVHSENLLTKHRKKCHENSLNPDGSNKETKDTDTNQPSTSNNKKDTDIKEEQAELKVKQPTTKRAGGLTANSKITPAFRSSSIENYEPDSENISSTSRSRGYTKQQDSKSTPDKSAKKLLDDTTNSTERSSNKNLRGSSVSPPRLKSALSTGKNTSNDSGATKTGEGIVCSGGCTERDLLIPLGSNTVVIDNEQHTMSMVVYFLQINCSTLEKSCILEVFTHMVRERVITRLRNHVILGYLVGCDFRKINGSIGFRISVESQFPPSAVNDAIEDCIENLEQYLLSLNHSDFKIHVSALRSAKMESHMKLADYNRSLWREIIEATYDFRRNHRENEHLNFITLSKVKTFYKEYIKKNGQHRRKLLLSIAPDPTLNSIKEEGNTTYNWENRQNFRDMCQTLPAIDKAELDQWFHQVFRSGNDGYQPPGEDPDQPIRTQPLSVHFSFPEIQRG